MDALVPRVRADAPEKQPGGQSDVYALEALLEDLKALADPSGRKEGRGPADKESADSLEFLLGWIGNDLPGFVQRWTRANPLLRGTTADCRSQAVGAPPPLAGQVRTVRDTLPQGEQSNCQSFNSHCSLRGRYCERQRSGAEQTGPSSREAGAPGESRPARPDKRERRKRLPPRRRAPHLSAAARSYFGALGSGQPLSSRPEDGAPPSSSRRPGNVLDPADAATARCLGVCLRGLARLGSALARAEGGVGGFFFPWHGMELMCGPRGRPRRRVILRGDRLFLGKSGPGLCSLINCGAPGGEKNDGEGGRRDLGAADFLRVLKAGGSTNSSIYPHREQRDEIGRAPRKTGSADAKKTVFLYYAVWR